MPAETPPSSFITQILELDPWVDGPIHTCLYISLVFWRIPTEVVEFTFHTLPAVHNVSA